MIDLSNLPAEGLRLSGVLGAIPLGEAPVDGSALRDVSWRVLVMPAGKDLFLEVKGDGVWEGCCSRCLEPLDQRIVVDSQFLGSKDPELVVGGAHTIGTQDLDVVYLPEVLLDEESLVREQFQLQVPMHPLCRETCEGLCPRCGKNWNKGRCACNPDTFKEPSALAKALSGLKLNLDDAGPDHEV